MAEIKLTKDNFEKEVLQSKIPVLVDFWADWCPPCKKMLPIIAVLGEERTDIKVGKVNVDEEQELAGRYSVMTIPTFIVFEGGIEKRKLIGEQTKEELLHAMGL